MYIPRSATICYCRVHNKINYKSGVFSREISFKKQRSDVILWNIFCSVRKFLLQPRVRWQFFLLAKIIVFLCVNLFKSGTWIRIYPYEKLDLDSNKMVLINIMLYLRIFLYTVNVFYLAFLSICIYCTLVQCTLTINRGPQMRFEL